MPTSPNLQKLRQMVYDKPELQAHLFSLDNIDEFMAELNKLINTASLAITDTQLKTAMQTGRQAWLNRKNNESA